MSLNIDDLLQLSIKHANSIFMQILVAIYCWFVRVSLVIAMGGTEDFGENTLALLW